MVDICQGHKGKNEVLAESIERYKEMFMRTKIEFQKLMEVRRYCWHSYGCDNAALGCWPSHQWTRSCPRNRPRRSA